MQRALWLYQTTVGKKILVAISGVVLFGFVFFHMLGNLQVFLGPQVLNEYSEFLHKPEILWTGRVVLLTAVLTHITLTLQLASRTADARPVQYKRRDDQATNWPARTMIWGGITILLFIVFHLLHLTVGYSPGYQYEHGNVYANVVHGFRIWWITAFYIVAQFALAMHLFHGVWSIFQTLGLNHPRWNNLRRTFATGFAAVVFAGNVSMPASIFAGLVPLEEEMNTIDVAAIDHTGDADHGE